MPVDSMCRNSADATRSEEPPPAPFSSATICGIEVIFTVFAIKRPIRLPVTRPAMIVPYVSVRELMKVTTIAMSMPAAEMRLPMRAVSGLCRRLSPVMNRTAAMR